MSNNISNIFKEEFLEEEFLEEIINYINDFEIHNKQDFKNEVVEYIAYLVSNQDQISAKKYCNMLEKLDISEEKGKNILYLYDFCEGEYFYIARDHKLAFINGNNKIN